MITPRGRNGLTLVEILVVLMLAAAVVAVIGFFARQQMLRKHCAANLRAIYAALEMHEIERGTLPRLAFYPDDPKQDGDSPLVVLRPYRAGTDVYVCPSAPSSLAAAGLTYVWNVRLNGKKLRGPGPPEWMLVEMNALSDAVPPPHLGRYNILYTDGRVVASKEPPPDLRGP